MESLAPEPPIAVMLDIPTGRRPRIWKFWGTTLWGLFILAAMILGQFAVIPAWFLWHWQWPADLAAVVHAASSSRTVSLSVIMGLPAVLAALWVAIARSGTAFSDYLALRWMSWRDFWIGAGGMIVVVAGWGLVSRLTGRGAAPDVMTEIMQSARADGGLWLLLVAFGVAAPATEELFARGFFYRGWSESFLGPLGAIIMSSLIWTAGHLQYDWFLLGEVFSLGLLLGYLRYRSNSIWLTIILHGLNNSVAVGATLWFGD
jgi:membrane protease YdiL (CAAX protease family)